LLHVMTHDEFAHAGMHVHVLMSYKLDGRPATLINLSIYVTG